MRWCSVTETASYPSPSQRTALFEHVRIEAVAAVVLVRIVRGQLDAKIHRVMPPDAAAGRPNAAFRGNLLQRTAAAATGFAGQ